MADFGTFGSVVGGLAGGLAEGMQTGIQLSQRQKQIDLQAEQQKLGLINSLSNTPKTGV